MNILLLLISDGHEAYLDHAVDQLDPDLKPVPPQPNCPESMQVYEDHRLVSTTTQINFPIYFSNFYRSHIKSFEKI